MATLADNWKKAMTTAEKNQKKVKKQDNPGNMPKFRRNIRQSLIYLEKFRADADKASKSLQKISQMYAKVIKQAQTCHEIAEEYEKTIKENEKSFTGPTSRGSVHDPLETALGTLKDTLDDEMTDAQGMIDKLA